jgi:hypothetical protein
MTDDVLLLSACVGLSIRTSVDTVLTDSPSAPDVLRLLLRPYDPDAQETSWVSGFGGLGKNFSLILPLSPMTLLGGSACSPRSGTR